MRRIYKVPVKPVVSKAGKESLFDVLKRFANGDFSPYQQKSQSRKWFLNAVKREKLEQEFIEDKDI